MPPKSPFSERHGFSRPKDITIREDAPEHLRYCVRQTAIDCGLGARTLRTVLCRLLRVAPDEENKYDREILAEVRELMNACPWSKVYDIIEELHAGLARSDQITGEDWASAFADQINWFFVDEGFGWQLEKGEIVTRGTEAFEAVVAEAISTLEASDRPTAAKCLHDALQTSRGDRKPIYAALPIMR